MPVESAKPEVKLRRVLSLGDLIIYGIVLIQPVAALPLFGHANDIYLFLAACQRECPSEK